MKGTLPLALFLLCGTASYGQADSSVCFTPAQARVIHDRLWAGDQAIRELEVANDQLENRNLTIQSLQEGEQKASLAARDCTGKLGAAIAARQVSDDRVIELGGQVAVLDLKVGKRFRLGIGIGFGGALLAGAGLYTLTR